MSSFHCYNGLIFTKTVINGTNKPKHTLNDVLGAHTNVDNMCPRTSTAGNYVSGLKHVNPVSNKATEATGDRKRLPPFSQPQKRERRRPTTVRRGEDMTVAEKDRRAQLGAGWRPATSPVLVAAAGELSFFFVLGGSLNPRLRYHVILEREYEQKKN